MSFAEPLAAYIVSAVVPNASESAIADLERSHNKADCVQTGRVKGSPIESLRNSVSMQSMKEIAVIQAGRLNEKFMRSMRSKLTPLKIAKEDQTAILSGYEKEDQSRTENQK